MVFVSLRRQPAAEPARVQHDRPVAAPPSPGDLDLDSEERCNRGGLVRGRGLLRCDRTGAQAPMVSAAIIALDLAGCYRTAAAESGKMRLRPLDRFVDPR